MRLLAVEWDGREVRAVSGSAGGGSVTIDHILSRPIPVSATTAGPDWSALGPLLKEIGGKAGIHSGDVLVAVARGQVELRNLQLPKGHEDELPDMVRFTAMRQFANVGDTWPIDFVTLPASNRPQSEAAGSEMQEVIAVTLNPATISQIRRVCQEAGFQVKQLGLRPMASGTLGADSAKSPIGKNATVLLIDVLSDEADMAVLEQGHVTFMRTVQLPRMADTLRSPLSVGEIRRTLIAAMNARPGLAVEKIILWGKDSHEAQAVAQWSTDLDLPVEVLDPLKLVDTKKTVEYEEDTGKFAPLLGLMLQHRSQAKQPLRATAVDFLHPRQRVEKKKPIRQYLLAAAAVLALLGSVWWWYYSSHRRLDAEIEALQAKLSGLEPNLKLAKQNSEHWRKVENYLKGDIQWLDELAYLSQKALPAEEMILRETSLALDGRTNEGKIIAQIGITQQELEPELEKRLRDELHKIGAKEVRPAADRNNAYGWTLDPEIVISPAQVVDPTKLPTPPAAAAPSPAGSAEAASAAASEGASTVPPASPARDRLETETSADPPPPPTPSTPATAEEAPRT
jgi:Tfp pilus assembly PilM family ATPase